METKVIQRKDIATILELEKAHKSSLFFLSDIPDIVRSVDSACSLMLTEEKHIAAFVLVHFTEYGTGYLEKIFVHPSYRGKGLQNKLVKKALIKIKEKGIRVCYTMVNPLNEISLSNFKDIGFIEFMDKKYKGHNRKILVYDFNC